MKKTTLVALACLFTLASFGKIGYKVAVNFPQETDDSVVYLAHFYAKSLPTIFKIDSAKVTPDHKVVFQKSTSFLGGVYMLIYKHNTQIVEFVLNNGDDFSIDIKQTNGKPSYIFKNSPSNNRYQAYNEEMEKLGTQGKALGDKLALAKNHTDTITVATQYELLSKSQKTYRENYIKQNPNDFLTKIFKAIQPTEIPKGPHYLADGKTVDSLFDYTYARDHYWDGFDFADDRLINTPIYDSKLNDYFSKWIYQIPDTINAAADKVLKAAKNSPELFHYTLRTLTANAYESKIMGMDEVFVYLVENYYMKGDATWLSEKDLQWYTDRAKKIKPNVLGNIAPDLNMQNVFSLQDNPLSQVKAKYTLLIVWSYDCPTCKKEIPQLDSAYNANLKARGLKVYSIAAGGDLDKIQDFVKNNKIEDWINVADVNNNTNFKEKYDAYATPKLYLLDENKKIIGKGLDHTNIGIVIDQYEKRKS